MAWQRREQSKGDVYHITMRGAGRQVIFEDDADRNKFLSILGNLLIETGAIVFAWCLMDNHVHMLVRANMGNLAILMQRLGFSYARYFNARHDHVGHVFQGRYGSVAIQTDEQLMAAVRYIHRNPMEAGLSGLRSYPWSSYGEYLGRPGLSETDWVIDVFGGLESFLVYHEDFNTDEPGVTMPRVRLSEAESRRALMEVLDDEGLQEVPKDNKILRDRILQKLKRKGLSIRRIERLTGIGRNIIARAK